jgi:hypothetical protein
MGDSKVDVKTSLSDIDVLPIIDLPYGYFYGPKEPGPWGFNRQFMFRNDDTYMMLYDMIFLEPIVAYKIMLEFLNDTCLHWQPSKRMAEYYHLLGEYKRNNAQWNTPMIDVLPEKFIIRNRSRSAYGAVKQERCSDNTWNIVLMYDRSTDGMTKEMKLIKHSLMYHHDV